MQHADTDPAVFEGSPGAAFERERKLVFPCFDGGAPREADRLVRPLDRDTLAVGERRHARGAHGRRHRSPVRIAYRDLDPARDIKRAPPHVDEVGAVQGEAEVAGPDRRRGHCPPCRPRTSQRSTTVPSSTTWKAPYRFTAVGA